MKQVLRFGVVGSVGFLVDGGLLLLLILAGTSPYAARGLSFPTAVATTWYLNRVWTFPHSRDRDPKRQFGGYLAVQIVGAAGNYLSYVAVLMVLDSTALNAMIAFAIGSFLGLFINFTGARFYVFQQ